MNYKEHSTCIVFGNLVHHNLMNIHMCALWCDEHTGIFYFISAIHKYIPLC